MKRFFWLVMIFLILSQSVSAATYKPMFSVNEWYGGRAIKSDFSLWDFEYDIGDKSVYKEKIDDNVIYFEESGNFIIRTDNTLWYKEKKLMDNVRSIHSYRPTSQDVGFYVIKTDGTLWAWGSKRACVPGATSWVMGDENTVDISYDNAVKICDDVSFVNSNGGIIFIIKNDYTLWAYGNGRIPYHEDRVELTTLTKLMDDVRYIDGCFIIKTDDTLYGWGGSMYTGEEKFSYDFSPEPVMIMSNVRSVGSKYRTEWAVKNDNTLWTWGQFSSAGTSSEWPLDPGEQRIYFPKLAGTGVRDIYNYSGNYILKTDGSLWGYGLTWATEPVRIMQLCAFNIDGTAVIKKGEETVLNATYYDDNGNPYNDPNITWQCEQNGVVSIYPYGSQLRVRGENGGKVKITAIHHASGQSTEFDMKVDDYRIEVEGRKPLEINEEAELKAVLCCGGSVSGDSAGYTWETDNKDVAAITSVGGTGNSSAVIKGIKSGIATVKVKENISGATKEFKVLVDVSPKISIYARNEKGDYGVAKLYFTVTNEKYDELAYEDLTEEEYESLTLKKPVINLSLAKSVYALSDKSSVTEYVKKPQVYVYENMTPGAKTDFSYSFIYGEEALADDNAFVNVAVCGEDFVPYCRNIDFDMDLPVKVIVNGEKVKFDALPVIENGRTLVPVRKIFNALGAKDEEIVWDEANAKVTAIVSGKKFELMIDSNEAYVDGEKRALDVPARILTGDRTYVPVRFISEAFGAKVLWNDKCYTVSITSGESIKTKASKVSDIKASKDGENSGFTTEEKEKWFGFGETYNEFDGGEIQRGTYQVDNLVVKGELSLPSHTRICVNGYLNVEGKIIFGDNSGIYVSGGDVTVKKKGILDMRNGGILECDGDFTFNSGINHENYLTQGAVRIGGDVFLKRNFIASKKSEFHILNKRDMHIIDVNGDNQKFNILKIEQRGFEVLDIRNEFECANGLVLEKWDVLEDYTFANVFELMDSPLSTKVGINTAYPDNKIKARVETGLMRAFLSEGIGSEFDMGKIHKSTKNLKVKAVKESVTYKYYDSLIDSIKEYTLDIDYTGVETMGIGGGFGTVKYTSGNNSYTFIIGLNPEQMEAMITGFSATVTANVADSIVSAYKMRYGVTAASCIATNVVKSAILDELPSDINKNIDDGEKIAEIIRVIKKLNDNLKKLK